MAKEALSANEVDALLNQLETKMSRLRSLYEQYFMGIERTPPSTAAKEVFRLVQRLENLFIRNTAQKFRLRSLVQRYTSYKTYWSRVEKQIEEGTFERHLLKAKRNQQRRTGHRDEDDGPPILEIELEEIQDLSDYQKELEAMDAEGRFDSHQPSAAERERQKQAKLDEIRQQLMGGGAPAPAPAPTAQAAPPQAASDAPQDERAAKLDSLRQRFQNRGSQPLPTGGASMDKLRELAAHKERLQAQAQAQSKPSQPRTIQRGASSQRVIQRKAEPAKPAATDQAREVYDRLIAAKRSCNESTSGLTYESVKQSMTQQKEQLKKKKGANDVDFKVVIKEGKAFLKPVPK